MRDFNRIGRVLELIYAIWEKQPDARFHQLIHNLSHEYCVNNEILQEFYKKEDNGFCTIYAKHPIADLYNVEDEDFIKFLEMKLAK